MTGWPSGPRTAPSGSSPPSARWGPAPCWCPLNTRFKGAEAAYILRQSGARLLFTVEGFLGTDYPRLLDEAVAAGEPVPDLERVVVLRTDDAAPRPPTAKGDPIVEWEVFLHEGGACSSDVAAGRTASITGGDLSDLVFTSGTTGQPQGGHDHPRPDPADLRHLGRGGRAPRRATAT